MPRRVPPCIRWGGRPFAAMRKILCARVWRPLCRRMTAGRRPCAGTRSLWRNTLVPVAVAGVSPSGTACLRVASSQRRNRRTLSPFCCNGLMRRWRVLPRHPARKSPAPGRCRANLISGRCKTLTCSRGRCVAPMRRSPRQSCPIECRAGKCCRGRLLSA